MEDPTIDELQAALTAANEKIEKVSGEAASYRKSKGELKAELEKFAGIDVDKYNDSVAAAAQAEQDRLKDAGKFEAALEKGLASYKAKDEQQAEMIQKQNKELSTMKLDNAFKLGMNGNAINEDHALIIARQNLKMEDGVPVVYDGDKPRLNSDGKAMTPTEYGELFLVENPQHAKPSGSGSGSQGNNGNNNQGANSITRAVFDDMDAVAKAAHFKAGGKVTD